MPRRSSPPLASLPVAPSYREADRLFASIGGIQPSPAKLKELQNWATNAGKEASAVVKARLLDDVLRMTQRAQTSGESIEAFQSEFTQRMADAGWIVGSSGDEFEIDRFFRTNLWRAYGTGRMERQIELREQYPLWRYNAVGDARTRPGHAALNGVVYPANAPFWATRYPPWDYNCRCWVTIHRANAFPADRISHDYDAPAGSGSGFTSVGRGFDWQVDYTGMDPTIASQLRHRLAALKK